MSGKTILILVTGLIAAFVVISLKNRMSQPDQVVANDTPVVARVLVAKRELSPGSFVQGSQDLDWMNAPEGSDGNENILREGAVQIDDFNGAVVRRALRAGEMIPPAALMKAGEGGFLSAVLEPGMRAVSIAVNATSGTAGFISPGDRVDLLVTHRIKTHTSSSGAEFGGEESVVSETFVHNVRVVAVDQMLDNPENKAILAKTVTVEVTPRQAEQVSVAAEMGKISMALRSVANATVVANSNGTGGVFEDYTRDKDLSSVSSSVPRVLVIRGDQSENLEFYRDSK